jgi:Protein of unknown function (DUF3108)
MRSEFHPPMTGQIVPWSSAPPWRILGALAVLVLLVHVLVLRTHPARVGQAPDTTSKRAPAFVTRSIALPPPVPAAPPAQAKPKPAVKPVKKPVLKQKEAVAQDTPALQAIDSIAEPIPEPIPAELPGAPADVGTTASSTAPEPPAAATDTPAASAAPAPPPGPSQTPVTAMALPASVQLDYKMTGSAKGLNYHAKGELAWQNSGSVYNARMRVSALFIGSRTMSSTGQVSAEGLAPTRFSDKSKNEVAAHFEADKGQVSFSANTPSLPWVKGSQDRVSVFMQLGGMLAGKPAGFPVGSTVSMVTVGPRDADTWTFVVEAQEKLTLPFGQLDTVKLSRQPRREFDQKVEIWYAPALGYLPVRNKITQANGDFVDQQLSALTRP